MQKQTRNIKTVLAEPRDVMQFKSLEEEQVGGEGEAWFGVGRV